MSAQESRQNETLTTPDLSEWSSLLTQQHAYESNEVLARLRPAARDRLIDAAQQYVLRLSGAAQQAGVAIGSSDVLTGDPQTQPIIMTGHQPVIFHGGLTFKYECTEQVAASQTAIAVAVTIDTDEGDPGAFLYPQEDSSVTNAASGQLKLGQASFCKSSSLPGSATLLPTDQLEGVIRSTASDLKQTTDQQTCEQFTSVSEDYVRLAKADIAATEANSIVRWSRGIGRRLLELPLSAICCFPEVHELTAEILASPQSFAQAYNDCLLRYREDHGIRNAANPFPSLQFESEGTELPFWIVDTSRHTRQRLLVRTVDGVIILIVNGQECERCPEEEVMDMLNRLALRNIQLIPRGALITSFLRLLFADLFVHGIGGGHYDSFTTEFIRTWWNVEPSPFVVASASQFLFSERRMELRKLQSLIQNLRDLRFNPQRHFGTGVFTNAVESKLRTLCEQKESIVTRLKSAQASGQSAREIGGRIQLVSDQMKQVVDEAFSEQLNILNELTSQTEETLNCRTYPWFLFPEH